MKIQKLIYRKLEVFFRFRYTLTLRRQFENFEDSYL